MKTLTPPWGEKACDKGKNGFYVNSWEDDVNGWLSWAFFSNDRNQDYLQEKYYALGSTINSNADDDHDDNEIGFDDDNLDDDSECK